jgi:hypothetical protein
MLHQIKNIKITKRILAIVAIIAILSALFIFVDIKILITVLLIEACELYIIFKILKIKWTLH